MFSVTLPIHVHICLDMDFEVYAYPLLFCIFIFFWLLALVVVNGSGMVKAGFPCDEQASQLLSLSKTQVKL